jgi:trigger factor
LIITQEEIVDSQAVIHIELEDPDLDPYLNQGYQRVVQRIVIPGFRKGKAPRRIVENFVGRESLLSEVIDTMVYEVTDKVIEEQKLEASGLPKIEDLELDPFTFKAVVPLRPEVDLGDYLSLRVPYEPEEVSEEDIEGRLDELRQSLATWEPVERPVELGDLVTVGIKGSVEGNQFMEEDDTTYFLDSDSTNPVPGFSQKMEGLEAEQQHEFTIEIPEDYQDTAMAGKEASFSVDLKDIKERILPELDDEFAKGLPEAYESVEVLRAEVEKGLTDEATNRSDRQYEDDVVKAMLDGTTMELSPVMLDHEIEHIEEDQNRLFEQLNIRRDDYLRSIGTSYTDQMAQARTEAEQRIRRTFALNKLGDLENIEVSEDELDERVQELLGQDPEGMAERLQQIEEQKESIERMLKYEKTVALLVSVAKGEAESSEQEEESEDSAEEEGSENTDNDNEETTTEDGGDDTDDSQA